MATSGLSESEVFINRFPIDLELELGPAFTERTTYTGVYNISDMEFDMSFRVQCSENYYGPNCAIFCEPMEGVYTCDSEGRIACIHSGQSLATNCTMCLPGWDPETSCSTCLSSFYDIGTNCAECLTGRDIDSACTTCLSGYDPSTNCTTQTTTTGELKNCP